MDRRASGVLCRSSQRSRRPGSTAVQRVVLREDELKSSEIKAAEKDGISMINSICIIRTTKILLTASVSCS